MGQLYTVRQWMVIIKTFLIISFVLLNILPSQAQQQTLGAIFDKAAYDALPHFPIYNGTKHSPQKITLRPYCPTPGNQGKMGACVGYAFGYSALTILHALNEGMTNKTQIDQHVFSPSFIFNQIKKDGTDCTTGASLTAAAKLLKEKGVCLLKDFDEPENCHSMPSAIVLQSAQKYKIKEAGAIFNHKATAEQKIAALKRFLRDSTPIVVNMQAYRSFVYLASGTRFWQKKESDEYLGLHSLVVIGYDERKQTFEVMSSWGTAWADGGFAEISYGNMGKHVLTAYKLMPYHYVSHSMLVTSDPLFQEDISPSNDLEKKKISPQSSVSSYTEPSKWQLELPEKTEPVFYLRGLFDCLELQQNGQTYQPFSTPIIYDTAYKMYRTQQATYRQGTLFQLQTSEIPEGKYVYIFTCDPKGKVELHWPKQLNTEEEQHVSQAQILPNRDVILTIPSTESALQLKHQGTDFLCILYSEEAIQDIDQKIQYLSSYTISNFRNKLAKVFSNQLIEADAVFYHPNKMLAQCQSTAKKGTIMPLVLCIETRN